MRRKIDVQLVLNEGVSQEKLLRLLWDSISNNCDDIHDTYVRAYAVDKQGVEIK